MTHAVVLTRSARLGLTRVANSTPMVAVGALGNVPVRASARHQRNEA